MVVAGDCQIVLEPDGTYQMSGRWPDDGIEGRLGLRVQQLIDLVVSEPDRFWSAVVLVWEAGIGHRDVAFAPKNVTPETGIVMAHLWVHTNPALRQTFALHSSHQQIHALAVTDQALHPFLARNRQVTADVLSVITDGLDDLSMVGWWDSVVSHPNTPPGVLDKAVGSAHPTVRAAVAAHPNLTGPQRQRLAEDPVRMVARAADTQRRRDTAE